MLTAHTQAVLLLTAHFPGARIGDSSPLTNTEWAEFACWLKDHDQRPEDLLAADFAGYLDGWSHKKITLERLDALLARGSALAMALEKWQRAGIWVITRSDVNYPKSLKKKLGQKAPPVFFGSGNSRLLNQAGIAMVGSRRSTEQDLRYSRELGACCASAAYAVVSGGARGVDESAMLGALDVDGTAVGILAKELLRSANSAKYRRHLMAGNLALVSPFNPEAGFNAGNAMQRNKYIYCMAQAAISVHSGTSGGTWNGVRENLKHGWVPMWIKPTQDPEAGNALLVKEGARWLLDKPADIDFAGLVQPASAPRPSSELMSLAQPAAPADPAADDRPKATNTSLQAASELPGNDTLAVKCGASGQAQPATGAGLKVPDPWQRALEAASLPLYEYFLRILEHQVASPKTIEELQALPQLAKVHKTQLQAWVKKAAKDGHIEVSWEGKTGCYRWNEGTNLNLL
ncbi:MAG TPA: DNA-processing protein DprA [Nitrococcus sp.]|nr:DNA-processing protein DprA [Nitrococcus sp.]